MTKLYQSTFKWNDKPFTTFAFSNTLYLRCTSFYGVLDKLCQEIQPIRLQVLKFFFITNFFKLNLILYHISLFNIIGFF